MWIDLLYYNNREVLFQSNPITKDITSNQLIGYHWLWSSYCNINKCLLFLSLWIHPGFKLDSCCSTIHFLCNVLSTIVCRFDLFLFGHCIVCLSLIYGFWLPFLISFNVSLHTLRVSIDRAYYLICSMLVRTLVYPLSLQVELSFFSYG